MANLQEWGQRVSRIGIAVILIFSGVAKFWPDVTSVSQKMLGESLTFAIGAVEIATAGLLISKLWDNVVLIFLAILVTAFSGFTVYLLLTKNTLKPCGCFGRTGLSDAQHVSLLLALGIFTLHILSCASGHYGRSARAATPAGRA